MSVFFKNLSILKLARWDITLDQLEAGLARNPLQPCQGDERQAFGWVKPHESATGLVAHSQKQILIALGTEKRLLPPSVINEYTKVRIAEIEEQTGVKVGRKQAKEIKEAVEHELLARAFTSRGQTQVWIDPVNGWLVTNGGGNSADEVVSALNKLFNGLMLIERCHTAISPSAAMTGWLSGGEAPAGFTVDQDCELKNAGEDKATVRYAHHDLGVEEIPNHIASGKTATKLAMTWQDKISFVLTESMDIKRVAVIGTIKTQGAEAEDFESEFALMTGEYALLLAALVEALGGTNKA